MIYLKVSQRVLKFLQMIPHFFQWFMILQHLQHLLMMTYLMMKLPPFLYELISPLQRSHRYTGCFQTLRCRTTFCQNSFLPFTITEWNKLDSDIKNIDSHAMFHKKLLTFIRPLENNI